MNLRNSFKTTVFLAALTGLFVVVGSAIGGRTGMVIAFLVAIAMNLGAWWFSDRLALRMNGAREVSTAEAPQLHELVGLLASRAGIPAPRVYVIDSAAPNAFATGRSPAKGAVAVTTGLQRMLTREELAGVIAHELAHIRNRDTLISSVAATIGGAVTMMAEMAQWALLFGGFGGQSDEEDGGGLAGLAGSLLMIVLAPIAAMLIQLAISRSREYGADAFGASIAGHPRGLASALLKIERAAQVAPPVTAHPATSHLFIVNPLRGGAMRALFSTHPPTEERVRRLLGREAAGAGAYVAAG